jgi:hypothetical protein
MAAMDSMPILLNCPESPKNITMTSMCMAVRN